MSKTVNRKPPASYPPASKAKPAAPTKGAPNNFLRELRRTTKNQNTNHKTNEDH